MMPWRELLAVVRVFWKGWRQHRSWGGWKHHPKDYEAALDRHRGAAKWSFYFPVDSTSGESHWAHVAANALILAWRERNK
jgi:hypothetical protein